MSRKGMTNNKNMQPILGKFVRRVYETYQQEPAEIVSYELSIAETEQSGYDPYDKPGPVPTEAQIDAMMRRRRPGKLRR